MPELRVLDYIARPMQRLGYLKRLIKRVTTTSTSSIDNLGQDLIDTVTRKVRINLTQERVNYIKVRLFDRVYKSLKEQADTWVKNGGEPPLVSMEIQDLYLADSILPSGVGKLVKEDWRKYPYLGVNIGLIRAGTYSTMTRALSFMYFTSDTEQKAFIEYSPEVNPFRLTPQQAYLLLYSFLDNDGEVLAPLWAKLPRDTQTVFNDRDVGNFLPEIYRSIISRRSERMISADLRTRFAVLEKSAESIALARQTDKYSGGSAREESSRVRIEPFVDIGIFDKPDPYKYEYRWTPFGIKLISALMNLETSQDIEDFLLNSYFHTLGDANGIQIQELTTLEEIATHLFNAWKIISSPGGYAPIEELALVAGIEALLKNQLIIEPAIARQALIDYQKANPYHVRFTVDRMGVLAHARFLELPDAMQQ